LPTNISQWLEYFKLGSFSNSTNLQPHKVNFESFGGNSRVFGFLFFPLHAVCKWRTT
jgi:hypothetical protein